MKRELHWDWFKSFLKHVLSFLIFVLLLVAPFAVFAGLVYFFYTFTSGPASLFWGVLSFAILAFSLYIVAGLFGFLPKSEYDAFNSEDDSVINE